MTEHNHDDYGIIKYHHDCPACVNGREPRTPRTVARTRRSFGRRNGMAGRGILE